jgi:ribosome-associated protein
MAKKKEASPKTTGKAPAKKKAVKKAVKKAPVKKAAAAKKTVPKKAKASQPKAKSVKKSDNDPNKKLADAVVEGILEVKGRNISVLDLRGIHNRVCDYFIICQADSNTQVNAIAGSVSEIVKKRTGERPYRSEGFENSEWILVDYVTVVVHIFQTQIRNFYNLESLWADAEVTEIAFD